MFKTVLCREICANLSELYELHIILVFAIHSQEITLTHKSVADQEFPRGGSSPQNRCANLLFCTFFAENCMKMKKEFGSGTRPCPPPLFICHCKLILQVQMSLSFFTMAILYVEQCLLIKTRMHSSRMPTDQALIVLSYGGLPFSENGRAPMKNGKWETPPPPGRTPLVRPPPPPAPREQNDTHL